MTTAWAHTNIALVKYWGKRDGASPGLNLPATGSLSMTLDGFGTTTTVTLDPDATRDVFVLDDEPQEDDSESAQRVFEFLDLAAGATREQRAKARVVSRNQVPTAAGLASSASAFAALALAAARAYRGADTLGPRELSMLARRGSGSAARSVFGGFVVMHRGQRDDGSDCFAEPMEGDGVGKLDARLVVVRCGTGKKATGSRTGMEHARQTSPFFAPWVDTHARDLADAQAAIAAGDIERLGEVMEHSTHKMHATTFTARPAFWYWNPVTLAVLTEVKLLRDRGTGAWATMDAGPHVKVLCTAVDAPNIARHLEALHGVVGVDVAGPGGPARIV
jgi:diphosphomevalonate decarboxylase